MAVPLQHKKKVIQETVLRIFRATSDWQSFELAHKKNLDICTEKSVSNWGEIKYW